jgi:hypothetical protein
MCLPLLSSPLYSLISLVWGLSEFHYLPLCHLTILNALLVGYGRSLYSEIVVPILFRNIYQFNIKQIDRMIMFTETINIWCIMIDTCFIPPILFIGDKYRDHMTVFHFQTRFVRYCTCTHSKCYRMDSSVIG